MKLPFVITQAQLCLLQTGFPVGLPQTPVAESYLADLLTFDFALFRANVSCACDLRRNQTVSLFPLPKLPLTSNPKQKYHQLTTLEEAPGEARACLRYDCG